MKKILRIVILILAFGLAIGSCSSGCAGIMYDQFYGEGDGRQESQTLTATMLGFERYARCEFIAPADRIEHEAWDCEWFASGLAPLCEEPNSWDPSLVNWLRSLFYHDPPNRRPIAAFVAQWMMMPLEWLLIIILFSIGLPPVSATPDPNKP